MKARNLLIGALPLVCTMAMAATPAPAAKPDLAKGQALSTQVCAACHTADGSRGSPANPILAGQHPEYLVKQLQEFKSGKRANAIMKGFASTLSRRRHEERRRVLRQQVGQARLLEGQGAGQAGREDLPRRHRRQGCPRLRRLPQPERRRHSRRSTRAWAASTPTTPRPRSWPSATVRAGNNAQMMHGVAAKMNDREIKAVSDYIAGLR
jgi:cytochrome c553